MLLQDHRINNVITVYQETKDKNDVFTKLIQKHFYDADPLMKGKSEPVMSSSHSSL